MRSATAAPPGPGWAVEDHLRTDLVETALRRAVVLRGELPAKVIFHADRGTQYTSAPARRSLRRPAHPAISRTDRRVLG